MSKPVVSIIMGSESDLTVMNHAANMLKDFSVPYEITIVSAHRTPDRMFNYAKGARSRGIKVIIAGAGGAAHLPGMVASLTPIPVIGVPVKSSSLSGVDSLYSICQMPRGIPVATVAIDNGVNAALLAVRMLGVGDDNLVGGMIEYMDYQQRKVEESVVRLAEEVKQQNIVMG